MYTVKIIFSVILHLIPFFQILLLKKTEKQCSILFIYLLYCIDLFYVV